MYSKLLYSTVPVLEPTSYYYALPMCTDTCMIVTSRELGFYMRASERHIIMPSYTHKIDEQYR